MIWHLLIKDLRRIKANPWPFLINLAMPLCITALIGLVFGGSSSGGGLGKIKIAVVDEDDDMLGNFISGAFNQGEAKKYLETRLVERTEAVELIHDNEVSAVVVIPKDFTSQYLKGEDCAAFEVIKNPAQSYYPAIVEELVAVLVEGLNAVARNLRGELEEWFSLVEGTDGRPDLRAFADLIIKIGDKFEQADNYLFPPLVTFEEQTKKKEPTEDKPAEFNLFGFLLPMLSSMFLLFMADGSIRDIYKELNWKTLDRFRTLHCSVLPLVISKVAYAVFVVALGGTILFGVGGLILGVRWQFPLLIGVMVLSFALFAGGFMALLTALARSEKRSDALNTIIIFGFAFMGGSIFQISQMPRVIRDGIAPWLPNYWFIQSIHGFEFGSGEVAWLGACLKLGILGLLLIAISTYILNRFLSKGVRA